MVDLGKGKEACSSVYEIITSSRPILSLFTIRINVVTTEKSASRHKSQSR
jgi:hypothetical protein